MSGGCKTGLGRPPRGCPIFSSRPACFPLSPPSARAMTPPAVDFRSAPPPPPPPAMRRARGEAEVGDDVFGDDPTVLALERRIAALAGEGAARAGEDTSALLA